MKITESERLEIIKKSFENTVFKMGRSYGKTQLVEDIKWLFEQTEKASKYKKALEFYANPNYYEPWRKEDEDRTDAFNFIDLDGGETAREVLKERTDNDKKRSD